MLEGFHRLLFQGSAQTSGLAARRDSQHQNLTGDAEEGCSYTYAMLWQIMHSHAYKQQQSDLTAVQQPFQNSIWYVRLGMHLPVASTRISALWSISSQTVRKHSGVTLGSREVHCRFICKG